MEYEIKKTKLIYVKFSELSFFIGYLSMNNINCIVIIILNEIIIYGVMDYSKLIFSKAVFLYSLATRIVLFVKPYRCRPP